MKLQTLKLPLFFFILFLGCQPKDPPPMSDPIYNVVGPTEEDLKTAQINLEDHHEFITFFKDKRHRVLTFKPVLENVTRNESTDSIGVTSWLATVYDYTNDLSYQIQLSPDGNELEMKKQEGLLPSNNEEVNLAKNALQKTLSTNTHSDNSIFISQAMPPVIRTEQGHRALTFWASVTTKDGQKNDVYAVNVSQEPPSITSIRNNFEGISFSQPPCGVPDLDSGTSSGGQMSVQIPDPTFSGANLWEFTVVSPRLSSGLGGSSSAYGSGVELLNIYYRGILVLKRAHTPKLNVIYDPGSCGIFDDGKSGETDFQATGTPLSSAFINCSTMPTTIVDNGNDAGNFKGVAFFKNNANNTFLVTSELQFGHYRYVSEWTFHRNGKIVPRFKFGSVINNCTCYRHVHHVYWRFDFDVNGTNNMVTESFANNPTGQIAWTSVPPFTNEVTRFRNSLWNMWSIIGPNNRQVDLIAGRYDGNATGDNFAKGDVFISKYYPFQINEWSGGSYTPSFNEANLIDNESISGQDIVLWYRAGSLHDESQPNIPQHAIVGPTINCKWRPHIYASLDDNSAK